MHAKVRHAEETKAREHMRRAGYSLGGIIGRARGGKVHPDAAADKKMVEKGVHQHERHDHKGEPLTKLKLTRGGHVEGEGTRHRIDRRARGGSVPSGKGHKGKGVNLNVIIHGADPAAQQQAHKQGAMEGMRLGAALGARRAAANMQRPMPVPPNPGMPTVPGGAMRPPPPGVVPTLPPRPPGGAPGLLAKGGVVHVREHVRRKAGGAV